MTPRGGGRCVFVLNALCWLHTALYIDLVLTATRVCLVECLSDRVTLRCITKDPTLHILLWLRQISSYVWLSAVLASQKILHYVNFYNSGAFPLMYMTQRVLGQVGFWWITGVLISKNIDDLRERSFALNTSTCLGEQIFDASLQNQRYVRASVL